MPTPPDPPDPSAALAAFAALFDAGAFWEAHEVLEGLWRVDGDPVWQGLIQIAAAGVHLQRGRPDPAARVLDRALGHLAARESPHVDLPTVRARAEALRDATRAEGPAAVFLLTPLLRPRPRPRRA